jgi:hypothetical protein
MIVFPVFLYAETHYRFKYFLSFLKKSEPEILADLPHRLDPDAALPILLLIKDSHHYPVDLTKVRIEISQEGKKLFTMENGLPSALRIAEPLWWKIIPVFFDNQLRDTFEFFDVDVYFDYTVKGKHRSCKNDNYRTSSKKSFRVYRSANKLPSFPGWIQGDAHTHSSYTNDQVEFGSPLEASVELCMAMGLSFFCATDHSYDLDDKVDDYLTNDPDLSKWKSFQKEVDRINSQREDFVIVRGEEVSCFNRAERNVHLLLWGTRRFFAGSGDSAERWFRTNAEYSIADILSKKDEAVVAYAGHPTETAPFFQRLFIRRGEWSLDDMSERGLAGIQIMNGEAGRSFTYGLECWSQLLLRGERIFIAAGNDAHGNFNRFKQIGIPFFTIREKEVQLFGKMRTAVESNTLSEGALLESLRRGESIITNGPLVIFTILDENGDAAKIGGTTFGVRLQLHILAKSSEEFGSFDTLRIFLGRVGSEAETVLEERHFSNTYAIDLDTRFDIKPNNGGLYIRVEGYTNNAVGLDKKGFCYTNPIWIMKK